MSEVYIVGVGVTPFGRFLEKSVKDLTREAVSAAFEDAGGGAAEIAFFANTSQGSMEGQHMIAGEVALRAMGIEGIPVINVENACASGATALNQGFASIKAGMAEVALVVGVEKMFHEDRRKSFAIFDGAWDVHDAETNLQDVLQLGAALTPADAAASSSRSVFMDIYAAWARLHMETFGTTERQIATVSAKNHRHSTHNPFSQYRHDMTPDEVLDARMIVWPLRLPMCAPISDGAAAAVLCGGDALERFPDARPVTVVASAIATGADRRPEEFHRHVGRRAALKAYEQAGLGPEAIDVAEIHDATAFAEIQQCENLGFCAIGEGGRLAESGATSLGGRIPVNTSGGLESKGHPIGATGLGQIHELVLQLRGEAGPRQVVGARFAAAENGGGYHRGEEAVVCVTILGRPT